MWEAIKQAASNMLERGGAFLRHSAAIDQILSYPTYETALHALRSYIFSIESAEEFQRFKETVVSQTGMTQTALQQAQSDANNSWGTSYEDRMAYLQAHIVAGEPAGTSGQTRAAEMRLQALMVMQQIVDPIWAEAQQSRAASAPAPIGGAGPG